MTETVERLFEGADWDFPTLQRIHDTCEEIARSELGLDVYNMRPRLAEKGLRYVESLPEE